MDNVYFNDTRKCVSKTHWYSKVKNTPLRVLSFLTQGTFDVHIKMSFRGRTQGFSDTVNCKGNRYLLPGQRDEGEIVNCNRDKKLKSVRAFTRGSRHTKIKLKGMIDYCSVCKSTRANGRYMRETTLQKTGRYLS